jgi:hypothetical protein
VLHLLKTPIQVLIRAVRMLLMVLLSALGLTLRVQSFVAINAVRVNSFLNLRDANEHKNSKSWVAVDLSIQPAQFCTAQMAQRFISIAIFPREFLIGTRFKARSTGFQASSVNALLR